MTREMIAEAIRDPIPGPASLMSRQLRRLGVLHAVQHYDARPVDIAGLPGVLMQVGGRRCAVAVSNRPESMKAKRALIYVPKLHLVASGVMVVGYSCDVDFDPFTQRLREIRSFDLAGWLPTAIVTRYPADANGLICVPYSEFKPMRKHVRI